jgi:hypothetical protein
MFRRRISRVGHVWPSLRPWVKSPLETRSRQDLQHANRLMEKGDFTNAAMLYEKLARKVLDFGRPRQAGYLYVAAARARLFANQVEAALDILKAGLSTFAQAGLWEAFERAGTRAVDELHQENQPQAAQELAHWLDGLRQNRAPVVAPAIAPAGTNETPHPSLPLKCPSCGATVRADEVEWVDDSHAMCDYCGSLLAAE